MKLICKEIRQEYMPTKIAELYNSAALKCFYVKRSENNNILSNKTGVLVDSSRRFVFLIAEDCKGMSSAELEATYLYGYVRAYAEASHDEAARFVEQAARDTRAAKRVIARFNVLKMRASGTPALTIDEWADFQNLSTEVMNKLFGDVFGQLDRK